MVRLRVHNFHLPLLIWWKKGDMDAPSGTQCLPSTSDLVEEGDMGLPSGTQFLPSTTKVGPVAGHLIYILE